MSEEQNINDPQNPAFLVGAVISRLIVYALIWIACYHICNVWLNDDGNMDLLWATMWTGNIAWIKPFWRWMTNGL